MSELLGEARVLIRPDTTRFRAELQAQVTAAARGVTVQVPVTAQAVVTGQAAGAAAATAAATEAAARSTRDLAREETAGAAAAKRAAEEHRKYEQTIRQVQTATVASAASLTGLRGAVLTAGGAFIAATVGIQAFGRAVGSAAELESTLNVFRVTVGATAEEMEQVSEQAKALGRDLELPGVTAQDAASSFLTLARAGLTVENALAGARGTLQLATAAEISFAEAAQLTASALNAFGLSGESAVAVADTLTNAANASQASISDMGIALQQSAAIADLVGFSLSETVTFLTQLAQAGLRGSDAGTSFRVAIQRLIAPTDRAREALDKLNVNLRDASGNLRPEAFFELGDALERMGRAQADATRQIIFGNDASRAAAFFSRLNAQLFRDQEKELQRQGAAAEVAAARNEGFAGSVENAKNQLAAFGIEIGELALPVLGGALDLVARAFGTVTTEIQGIREEFSDFQEDIESLASAARDLSDDSGFTAFLGDVAQGAGLARDGFNSMMDAGRDLRDTLFGIGGGSDDATTNIRELTEEERRFAETIFDATRPVQEQTSSLRDLANAAAEAAAAVARLQGQQRGLEEQVTRARIAGDENTELQRLIDLRESLEEELRRQEAIIARPGVQGEATAREAIRERILPQLEQTNNEIDRIIQDQTATRERQAEDAARAAGEADRALLDALSGRRAAQETAIAAAEARGADVVVLRLLNEQQETLRRQIVLIREQVQDEKAKRDAINSLRSALIASNAAERALNEERRRAREEAERERQERRDQIQELNIQIADERGNDAALERAINARIATLNKQIAAAKGDQLRVKQLILERERLRNQLDELNEKDQDARNTFAEFVFEQRQAQQGFAANLLGNLITGPTAGLVGVPSPAAPPIPDLSGVLGAATGAAAGRQGGQPTAGQQNTVITLLERILGTLKAANRADASPEAKQQRREQSGVMDGVGGSGTNAVM